MSKDEPERNPSHEMRHVGKKLLNEEHTDALWAPAIIKNQKKR